MYIYWQILTSSKQVCLHQNRILNNWKKYVTIWKYYSEKGSSKIKLFFVFPKAPQAPIDLKQMASCLS